MEAQAAETAQVSAFRIRSAARHTEDDVRALLGVPSISEVKTFSAQIKAQMQAQANETAQVAAFRVRSAARHTEDDVRALLGVPSISEVKTFSAQIKAQMEAEQQALAGRWEKLKAEASRSYTGRGISIAAAQAMSGEIGEEATKSFLGPKKSSLLPEVSTLEQYKRKVGEATAAQHSLNQALRDGHSAARGLASGFGAIWLTWGQIAPLLAGAAISHGLVKGLRDGMQVGNELALIKNLGGESAASVERLNAALLDTRNNGPFGPREIASALKTLAMAGLDARQQLEALPAVKDFSVVGQVSLEKSAESLVSIATAYGYSARDFNVVGDMVAKAAASSMASIEGMSESFKTASVVAQQYRVSLADTSVTLALLSQIGIKGSAAGTAMRQMYSELTGASEKARKVLERTLNVDVIDRFTGGIRPLSQIIPELAAALDKFDAKSQIRVLQDLGNERGTKALVANLSAYRTSLETTGKVAKTELDRMRALMADAPGFMAMAASAQSLTAQNQVKAVASALEASLVKAFQSVEPAVLELSMKLKEVFSSKEFQSSVKSLMTLVAEFTSVLVKHADVVYELARAYVAWKAVTLSFAAITSLTNMVTTLSRGVATLGVTSAAAAVGTGSLNAALSAAPAMTAAAAGGFARLQVAMGWIGAIGAAIGGAVAMWALYKERSVDASTESGRAAGVAARASLEAIKEETARLNKLIEARRNGTTEALAAQEVQRLAVVEQIRQEGEAERAILRRLHAQNLANKAKIEGSEFSQSAQGVRAMAAADKAIEGSRAALVDSYMRTYEGVNKAEEAVRALKNAASTNAKMATEEASGRVKGNFGKEAYVGDQSALAHADELAKSRLMIEGLKAEEAEMAQYMKFRKDLDEAKYNPNLFGPFIGAAMAEQRALSETSTLLQMQARHIEELRAAKANAKTLTPADQKNLDKEILQEETRFKLASKNLEYQTEIARAKGDARARAGQDDFNKTLEQLGQKDVQRNIDITASYELRTLRPEDAAAEAARLAVQKEYGEKIVLQQLAVERSRQSERELMDAQAKALEGLLALEAEAKSLSGEALTSKQQQVEAQRADLAVREAGLEATRQDLAMQGQNLEVLKQRAQVAAKVSAEIAKSQAEYAQTAAYGWEKFWADYAKNAESSAKLVEDSMKTATTAMSASLEKFFMAGKMDAKSLGETLRAELTKAMLVKPMMDQLSVLMKAGGNFILNALSGGGGGGLLPGGVGNVPYAKGGVFGTHEAFARGGTFTNSVVSRPTPFMFAKGSKFGVMGEAGEEAVVPLKRGPGGVLGVANYGGSAPSAAPRPVTLNVINNGAPVKAQSSQRETPEGTIIDLVLDAVASDMASGGRVHDATQRRFGLNPGGTTPRY